MPSNPSPVRAWVEPLTIPTYPVGAPDPNPMFFETRNIQGAKGNIYPSPFTDQLSSEKVDQTYQAVYLENEYLQMILLPEIGGRIFAGLDKTNGYDFFYRHKVIKPALIGLFGPWISGGVEFNWPQHHRPSTFSPTETTIEEHPDGSVTVWMSEHEPLNRTKGMVGICLYPGRALVETKVRLFNRTPIPQTFLWWANAGVHINEQYQVIFPPDVHYAVYHAKNPVTQFPLAQGSFLGNDYGEGTDVSYWANSPQATSFFAGESKYEFFGGYDHARGAGVVHVADSGISPGKKFFTWGNGSFGHTWQSALMDDEGEYLELMAGVYTDNQPDFTWIAPYETKTFSQYWYPVQKIGGMVNANTRAALNLEIEDGQVSLGVCAVETFSQAQLILTCREMSLLDQTLDLVPGRAFTLQLDLPGEIRETDLVLRLLEAGGGEVIRYQPEPPWDGEMPAPYQPPPAPEETGSIEELYLAGLHLEQYRHVSISPEPYWREGLRRDPDDSRCNTALGRLLFRRADYEGAEAHFRTAVKRLTWRNFNPTDSEAHYNLGLSLQYLERFDEAYKAFYKATWSYPWRSAGYYALAQIDSRRGDFQTALEHLEQSLQANPGNHKARNLKAALLRRTGRLDESAAALSETLADDPLDHWARYEQALIDPSAEQLKKSTTLLAGNVQTYLDIAFDYANAGLWQEAYDFLEPVSGLDALYPMVAYGRAYFLSQLGDETGADKWRRYGTQASPDYTFPWRLEELAVLRYVLSKDPQDGRACCYLGNLLYDKQHYEEAVQLWQQTSQIEPDFAIPWRNLALAAFNRSKDIDQALVYLERAWMANQQDPRFLLELDQLRQRKGFDPRTRLDLLESNLSITNKRDDLVIERAALHNRLGSPKVALEITTGRHFHAWEGGEGRAASQYANALWLLGCEALEAGDASAALEHFTRGLDFPSNLGVTPFEGETIHLVYYRGLAQKALGQAAEAQDTFKKVLTIRGWMHAVYYRALAAQQLGQAGEAQQMLYELRQQAAQFVEAGPRPNYFYAGKPSPVFEDDLKTYNRHAYLTALGLASLGLGDRIGARSAFKQALALNPANLFAHKELKRLSP